LPTYSTNYLIIQAVVPQEANLGSKAVTLAPYIAA
jgi:hypothetical protein